MAETKEQTKEQKKAEEAEKVVKELVENTPLPTLMSVIVRRIMSALETDNAGTKQQAIAQSQREFRLWYESQPVEDRREFAKKARKSMENFKLIGEQFYQELMAISSQDM